MLEWNYKKTIFGHATIGLCFVIHCIHGGCIPSTSQISDGAGYLSADYGPFSGGECKWLVEIPTNKALVLQTNALKMFYELFHWHICTASLIIGIDEVKCKVEQSFCHIYTDNPGCNENHDCVTKLKQGNSKLEIKFQVPWNIFDRQFRISYKYQNCSTEQTTTQLEKEVTTFSTTKTEEITSSTNISFTVNKDLSYNTEKNILDEPETYSSRISFAHIVLIIVGCLLIVLVVVTVLFRKSNKVAKDGQSSNSYTVNQPTNIPKASDGPETPAAISNSFETVQTNTTSDDGKIDCMEMKDNIIYETKAEFSEKSEGDSNLEIKDNIIYGMDLEANNESCRNSDKCSISSNASTELKDNIIYEMNL